MALDPSTPLDPTHEEAVHERYSAAAARLEPALCCPVEYDPRHLEVIPAQVLASPTANCAAAWPWAS